MDKYSWSFKGDAELWYEGADTIEECIAQAKSAIKSGFESPTDTVFIGENIPFNPVVDAESVLEAIEEQACEFCGETAEDWKSFDPHKDSEIVSELSDELTSVVNTWLKKHDREPYFYKVDGIKAYPLIASKPERSETTYHTLKAEEMSLTFSGLNIPPELNIPPKED